MPAIFKISPGPHLTPPGHNKAASRAIDRPRWPAPPQPACTPAGAAADPRARDGRVRAGRLPEASAPPGLEAAVVLRLHIDDAGAVQVGRGHRVGRPGLRRRRGAALSSGSARPRSTASPRAIKIAYRYEFAARAAAQIHRAFHGVIRAPPNLAPVREGITVTAPSQPHAGRGHRVAGRFQFTDLPPGTATVTLAGERLPALEVTEEL